MAALLHVTLRNDAVNSPAIRGKREMVCSEESKLQDEQGAGTAVGLYAFQHPAGRRVYFLCKRAFDVAASASAVILLLPVFAVVALLGKLDSRGPVFFTQPRLGKDGKLFTIYKFRTMAHNAAEVRNPDGSKFVGRNDPRLTRLGHFLRDYSIDELPQLLNILKGEMSVVGPRPDTPGAPGLDDRIFQIKRSMRPGLTSLASVNGRNSIPWRERVAWEQRYVEHASFALDLWILWKTVGLVIKRDGIYSSN